MPRVYASQTDPEDMDNGIQIKTSGDLNFYKRSIDEESTDVFAMSGEDLSKLTGLSHNFKRKMQRDIQKYQAYSASGFATNPPSAIVI